MIDLIGSMLDIGRRLLPRFLDEEMLMSIDVTCTCGKVLHAKEEHAGRRAKCPDCGEVIQIPSSSNKGAEIYDLRQQSPPPTPESSDTQLLSEIKDVLESLVSAILSNGSASMPSESAKKQYKVLTQKDKWFSGKFDPERLEQAVNAYADQGWRVRGVATASIPGFGGARDELIILMER